MKPRYGFFISLSSLALASSCGTSGSDHLNTSAAASGVSQSESLYVASGACYGGGVALSTGSGTVAAFDPSNGTMKRVVVDYSSSPGDLPVALSDYDSAHILVTIENASGRRVDLVNKDGSGYRTYLQNSTALNGILRASKYNSDGTVLISKSTAIEKFTSAGARILQAGLPFINAPASTCATVATLLTGIETLSNGKVVLAHSAATPNNKLVLISSTGYSTTADCLASQAAPTTLAMPTAVLTHSSGQLLVAYGSTTAASNFVYSYPVNATTNSFGTPVASYSDWGVLVNGPSALAEDPLTADVYVANALSTLNTIERFSFNPSTGTLTSKPSRIGPNAFTRCVSAMKALKD